MNIDFVILWVDGNDIEWQREKEKYTPGKNSDVRVNRYRDWDNLQYWFRGVEKFAPWVRKIHFVTWGHLPKWLNVNNPKLHIVNHKDYIPREYLPTFNANPIELNLHRIKGLAENFVYFNDDMFIIKSMKKEEFFKDDLPCDIAALEGLSATDVFSYMMFNNMRIINKNFRKKDVFKYNKLKWFNLLYGKELYRTIALYPWENFTGMFSPHLPIAFNKRTFKEVWDKEYDELHNTCLHRFRNIKDVTGWLFRYWRIATGEFYPISPRIGKYFSVSSKSVVSEVGKSILKQNYKMICINDTFKDDDFDQAKHELIEYFQKILPEKSSFEI